MRGPNAIRASAVRLAKRSSNFSVPNRGEHLARCVRTDRVISVDPRPDSDVKACDLRDLVAPPLRTG